MRQTERIKAMKTYKPLCGEDISTTAKRIVAMAKRERDVVKAKFNDIELTANPDTTADSVVAFYGEESKRRGEAYRNSPEGKKAAREAENRRVALQQKHNALMQQLPTLNFTDDVAVLDWLCELQDPSDHTGVVNQKDVVISTFAAHGYYPSVNTGKDFNENDRDNFVRYVIGQALANLREVGAIHRIIHKFTENWKKKFLTAA